MQNESFQRVLDAYHQLYMIADPGIVKLLFACVIAHRMKQRPIWLFVVGPSSSGKTEFLDSLCDLTDIYSLDGLTTSTFISGQISKERETSLLFKISDKIITFKDFTTVLSMQKDARGEIMGQLRKIYDGELNKSFGNGQEIKWAGSISMLSGVTTSIYMAQQQYASLGERFIMYAMKQPDRKQSTMKAMRNLAKGDIKASKKELARVVGEYLMQDIFVSPPLLEIDDETLISLIELADIATNSRSAVERNWASNTKEITFVHDAEMPMRFASMLRLLAGGLVLMNDDHKLTKLDRDILFKVTLDSIPKVRRLVMQQLTQYETIDNASLALKLNVPASTSRIWVEDLHALGMVDRTKRSGKDFWALKREYREIMEKFDGVAMTDEVLEQNELDKYQEYYEEQAAEITPSNVPNIMDL